MHDILKRAVKLRACGKRRETKAFAVLAHALSDPLNLIRVAAIQGLGFLGDCRAIPLLAQTLGTDPCPAVRWDAAESLGALHAAPTFLVPGAHDADPRVRRAVAGALTDVGAGRSILVELAQDTDIHVASKAKWALDVLACKAKASIVD